MDRPVKKSPSADWSIIFDSIASEYGYTWGQFVSMTYKMLDACLEAIARRTHNQTAVLASMHGIKMDLYKRIKPISEKTLDQARAQAYKILKRKQLKTNGKGKRISH